MILCICVLYTYMHIYIYYDTILDLFSQMI